MEVDHVTRLARPILWRRLALRSKTTPQTLAKLTAPPATLKDALLDLEVDAVVVVAPPDRLVYANAAAKTLLALTDTLCLRAAPAPGAPSPPAWLGELMDLVLAEGAAQHAAFEVSGCEYEIWAAPIADPNSVERLVRLQVRDLDQRLQLQVHAFARLHRMSRAETAVLLGLVKGQTPQEYAAAAGVKVTTVRSQIQFISRKTGIGRQTELVGAVLSLWPPPG